MSDAEAFMKIGERFAQLEQRQKYVEQLIADLIAQLNDGKQNDGTEQQPKTSR